MTHSGKRVLIVDDNRDSARALSLLLSVEGFETQTAFDGPSALESAAEFEPDALLLDIGLPGMDGYEVAMKFNETHPDKDVLLVAISGYGQAEDQERARQAGFHHHLVKPVDHEVILEILNRMPGSGNGSTS